MDTYSVRPAVVVCALVAIAIVIAAPVRAQGIPTAKPPPAVDPRRGPRLRYERGPAACVSEGTFRDEVAILLDGVDHFDQASDDEVHVWFEKSTGGFRGTVEYTDKAGKTDRTVKTYYNCEGLARWVAGTASGFIPAAPAAPTEVPTAAPSAAPTAAPAPVQTVFVQLTAWAPPPLPPQDFSVVATGSKPHLKIFGMDATIGVSALILMTAGYTANVGPGFGVGLDVRFGKQGVTGSLGLEFRGIIPGKIFARDPVPSGDPTKSRPTEFDVSQLTGLAVPCLRWSYFVGCGVLQVGGLVAAPPYNPVSFTLTGGLGPRVGFEVPFAERFAVFGFGEALFAIAQPSLVSYVPGAPEDPSNVQWEASPVSAFFAAGVLMKFE